MIQPSFSISIYDEGDLVTFAEDGKVACQISSIVKKTWLNNAKFVVCFGLYVVDKYILANVSTSTEIEHRRKNRHISEPQKLRRMYSHDGTDGSLFL